MTERARRAERRSDWATIPNAVTLVRLVLLVPVCMLLVRGGPDPVSVVLLLVWALTDWIDGYLARALDQVSRVGEALDPVADRIGLVGIVLALALAGLIPWAALVAIALVDVVVAVATARTALRMGLGVSLVGKARTAILMVAVFLLAAAAAWAPPLVGPVQVMLWIGVALHVVAGIGYLLRARGRAAEGRSASAPAATALGAEDA